MYICIYIGERARARLNDVVEKSTVYIIRGYGGCVRAACGSRVTSSVAAGGCI